MIQQSPSPGEAVDPREGVRHGRRESAVILEEIFFSKTGFLWVVLEPVLELTL